ncbi:hypothetical protein EC973_002539 [Apophysomyces ossiformis]|uniref:Uncharacterized protein n=1 Tax=Apophysomyces ossiformis TaxID=679940 RepID=A0A8H7BXN9_9FUNG|nr:hypothetical protein EC973_002539 [Apophysomyces ossiformis]
MPATFNITKYLDTYPPSFLAKIYLPKQVIGLKIRGEFDYLTPTSHGYIKTPGPFNVAGFYSVVFTDDLDDLAIFFEREGEEDTTFEFWGQSIGSYKVERLEGNAIASKKRQSMYQQSF